MSTKNIEKCPKCNGEMEKGTFSIRGVQFMTGFLSRNRNIILYACKNCGYTEMYAEIK